MGSASGLFQGIVVAVLTGLGALGLSVLAMMVGIPVLGTMAAGYAVAGVAALAAAHFGRLRPSFAVPAAVGLLFTVPLVGLAAVFTLSEPIVASHWRCGTGLVGLVLVAPLAFAGFGAVGASVGGLAARLTRLWPRMVVLARVAVVASLAASGLLVVREVVRSPRPDAQGWLEGLPAVHELPPVPPFSCTPAPPDMTCEPRVDRFTVAGHELERRCHVSGGCTLRLAAAGEEWAEVGDGGTVYVAAEQGLLFVDRAAVFDLRDGGRLIDLDVRRLSGAVGAPRSWVWIAALGFVVALLPIAVAARRIRERRLFEVARAGWVEAGVLRFDDAEHPLRARPVEPVGDGPVLALPTGLSPPPGYRCVSGPPWRVAPGTRVALLASNRAAEHAAWLIALAIGALAAAPLFTAALGGL
jgi:hypothetical protein